ncbi:unnamed protein product [Ilex paraguariensis]|uniref:Uncharacterized protein n=1 Tax=Ilex paraguariensis TaxID=185542 RepID=A0ABC8TEB6_9AQUA
MVTCEHMVDRNSLGKIVLVRQIVHLRHDVFFELVGEYILSFYREFYTGLHLVDLEARILRTTIQGCIIQVTLDSIAKYLGYVRPQADKVDYPHYEFSAKSLLERLFEALLLGETLPVIPPLASISRAITSKAAAPTNSTPPPTFMSEPRDTVQKIGNSDDEEEAGVRPEDEFWFE